MPCRLSWVQIPSFALIHIIGGHITKVMIDGSVISPHMAVANPVNLARLKELSVKSICDKCVQYEKCANQSKACVEFTQFVDGIPGVASTEVLMGLDRELNRSGSKRIPTRDIYKQHFSS